MPIRKYGAAYQGSKSKIADEIISLLPARKYFIDAFSGGGALAHCALESGKFEHIIANDIQTKDILEAHFLWTPEQHLEFQKKWVTKEEFEKTDNLYIKTCWSFSNNRKAYIYSKACYEYKRRLHNAICFGNYKEFEDYCGIDLSEIDSYDDLNERRKAARRAILKALKPYSFKETINSNTHIPKEIYDAILGGNKDWRNLGVDRSKYKCVDRILRSETLETSKGLVNIISSENLERTKQGKSIERLQNLQSMEASKQGKNIENILCLTNIERTKQSKNVESLAQQENLLRDKNISTLTQSQHLINSDKNISTLTQSQHLINRDSNISITSVSYDELDLPDPSETVIICDAPYRDTQGYQVEFDNDKFEQWCMDRARDGYEVFVCEYNIENPAFEEVWSKEVINGGGGNKNQKKSVEKLYHVK